MPISQVCLLLLAAIIAFPAPHLNNFLLAPYIIVVCLGLKVVYSSH